MRRQTIAVIEDEADILEVMAYALTREGYRVLGSRNGEEGLGLVRAERPDLVVLDLMLPGVDGLEICRRMKLDPELLHIPIIMVTAKGEESDVVLGLGLGADDYMAKPFSPRELAARVKAVLRRAARPEPAAPEQELVRGVLVVDPVRHQVRVEGEPVSLTATEFRLLRALAARPGRVLTREALLGEIIAGGAVVGERNVDVHMRALRKKLGAARDLLETIRGVGYRLKDEED